MSEPIQNIPFNNLALVFIPVVLVILILWKWKLAYKNSLYAMSRMLIQLLLIGYALVFIFKNDNVFVVSSVLCVMLLAASWIALRSLSIPRRSVYLKSLSAISLASLMILLLVSQGVLELHPWYSADKIIPLAGMLFASSMNSVSLAGERLEAEISRQASFEEARIIAFKASLIPITNSLFAVGLVSLPGMMTGQILSGVSPFIAARYQIMVMCMLFGSAGISSALFLTLLRSNFKTTKAVKETP